MHASIRDALIAEGWPTLSQVQGMVIFHVLKNKLDVYSDGGTNYTGHGRLFFLDSACTAAPCSGSGSMEASSILTFGDADASTQALVATNAFLIRGRCDSNTNEARKGLVTRRDQAISFGSHFVATDYPYPSQEGQVRTKCASVAANAVSHTED